LEGDSLGLKGGFGENRRSVAHSKVQGRGDKPVPRRGHYYSERGEGKSDGGTARRG